VDDDAVEQYLPAITTILGALIALGGVALASRASDRRAREDRLWSRRADAYVESLRFLNDLDAALAAESDGTNDDEEVLELSRRTSDLDARLAVFADEEALAEFRKARVPDLGGVVRTEHYERLLRQRIAHHEHGRRRKSSQSDDYGSPRYNPSFLDGGTGYGADRYLPANFMRKPYDSPSAFSSTDESQP
jgi:hypothetical protein